MVRAVLIYNPESGRRRGARASHVEAVADALRAGGIEVAVTATRAAGSAGEQAREAIANGYDAVFACGGDGTVNEVLQGVAGSKAALAVIPLGTANSLAADLGVPRDPVAAAQAALRAETMRVAVGQISSTGQNGSISSRFFIVAAGIGADAHLVYTMTAGFKQRYGYAGYFAYAWRTWAMHSFPPFEIEFTQADGAKRHEIISQLLASRIADFGGLLRRLVAGAALQRDVLRLALFKTPDRLRYLQYMTNVLLGRSEAAVRDVELVDAVSIECRPLREPCQDARWRGRDFSRRIYAEADGELLGTLPATVTIVPDAVTLLAPRK